MPKYFVLFCEHKFTVVCHYLNWARVKWQLFCNSIMYQVLPGKGSAPGAACVRFFNTLLASPDKEPAEGATCSRFLDSSRIWFSDWKKGDARSQMLKIHLLTEMTAFNNKYTKSTPILSRKSLITFFFFQVKPSIQNSFQSRVTCLKKKKKDLVPSVRYQICIMAPWERLDRFSQKSKDTWKYSNIY